MTEERVIPVVVLTLMIAGLVLWLWVDGDPAAKLGLFLSLVVIGALWVAAAIWPPPEKPSCEQVTTSAIPGVGDAHKGGSDV